MPRPSMARDDAHQCPQCSRSFTRPEHLKRHVAAVHRRNRAFPCSVCGRCFYRDDSRLRHQQSLHGIVNGTRAIHAPRELRACDPCAAAKAKCSGVSSCVRCQRRHLECTFNRHSMRGATPQHKHIPASLPASHRAATNTRQSGLPSTGLTRPSQNESACDPIPLPPDTCHQDSSHQDTANAPLDDEAIDPKVNTTNPFEDIDLTSFENMNWLPVIESANLHDMPILDLNLLPSIDSGLDPVGFFDLSHTSSSPVTDSPIAHTASPYLTASSVSNESGHTSERSKRKRSLRYVDGNGARETLQKRARLPAWISPGMANCVPGVPLNYHFPAMSDQDWGAPREAELDVIHSKYVEIVQRFHEVTISDPSPPAPVCSTSDFPPRTYTNHCFQLYLGHIDCDMPIIHHTAWKSDKSPWFLVLAAVTIGACAHDTADGEQASFAFQEFLRRALKSLVNSENCPDMLALVQAYLLHVASMAQLPGDWLRLKMPGALSDLRVLLMQLQSQMLPSSGERSDASWEQWILNESIERCTLFQWQLETFLAFSTNAVDPPPVPNNTAMPSVAAMWNAESAEAWTAIRQRQIHPQTKPFWPALQRLYFRQEIQDDVSAYGQTSLIYGILSRTEEVAQHLQQPLRKWNPAPESESQSPQFRGGTPQPPEWLPAHPEYSAWRNSACDCLDTIHWKANSETAAAKGLEGPVVLHLHLARLLLLCPIKDMLLFVAKIAQVPESYALLFSSRGRPRDRVAEDRLPESILKWLMLDDHKGRLCLPHAGAIFWHLRRYSRGSHYEPFAAFVAAVVLWTYGRFLNLVHASLVTKSLASAQRRQESTGPSQDFEDYGISAATRAQDPTLAEASDHDDTTPTTILLDRPCDDEIVQAFVLRGHCMTAAMSGAGAINTPYGLQKVLVEAIKLLHRPSYTNFARAREYECILSGLL